MTGRGLVRAGRAAGANGSISRRGFALVDLAAVCVMGSALLAGGLVLATDDPPGPDSKDGQRPRSLLQARAEARQLKDATAIRGITQAMIVWSNNNKEQYPLPSKCDLTNTTVAVEGRAKDTTANIFSILIFNGAIPTEMCISAAEVNRKIRQDDDYTFTNPPTAVKPEDALWDPAFNADFMKRPGGNLSFAHLQPSDERLSMWSDTFQANHAILGNRGPAIAKVEVDEATGSARVQLRREKSKTFRIHGPDSSWEGNIAYNDGHVSFETTYAPEDVKYTDTQDRPRPDVLFFDEKDAKEGTNAMLGIWRKAGAKAGEFGGIWD